MHDFYCFKNATFSSGCFPGSLKNAKPFCQLLALRPAIMPAVFNRCFELDLLKNDKKQCAVRHIKGTHLNRAKCIPGHPFPRFSH